ncbi:target of rapamycin complex subunit LST8 isoform X2 [Chelonia mydas]|uniref:target of rapamycin complex subunit LST8 isoform X2 n=1 Tax=Chelonia mydas TaxID=8469 RepID=UPI0018A20EA1|nr:target of rapamycin complex subunit LST8 isoform X2 [Chelonia mydas]
MNAAQGTVGSDPVILATAGYDHTVRFWQAHSGICTRTVQHQDSQVNALEITPDRSMIAAAGYQHIRMYDLNSNNPNPVINYDGVSKNITSVGFHEDGRWMYTGGEDCMARIWDLRSRNLQCQRIFQVNAPINCVCLHPNQAELIVGDQSGAIHIWDLKTDHNEQLIPEPEVSVNSVHIDPDASYMAAVNSSVGTAGEREYELSLLQRHIRSRPAFAHQHFAAARVSDVQSLLYRGAGGGQLLCLEFNRWHWRGGNSANPQDQNSSTQPLCPSVQVQP